MQDAGANILEIHLPERWAVLEQALRQMHAEDAEQLHRGLQDEDGPIEADGPRRHSLMR